MLERVHSVFAECRRTSVYAAAWEVAHHGNRVNEDAYWTIIMVHTSNTLCICIDGVVNNTLQYRSRWAFMRRYAQDANGLPRRTLKVEQPYLKEVQAPSRVRQPGRLILLETVDI